MDLKDKIVNALVEKLHVDYVRLEDDDGISGFVVSPLFRDVSALDRQILIEEALNAASNPLTPHEQRRVLMIAGLTPKEYIAVGARIRVHRVKELPNGRFEILLHGGKSEADYVRAVLDKQEGVRTTDPKQDPGAIGILMTFFAFSDNLKRLTKVKILRMLRADRYIEVMSDA
jgi:hypothetical protein